MDKKKILIIEDDPAIVYPLVEFLKSLDYIEVIVSNDGEEGLNMALSGKPDLILLDIIMPKMDGMEMLRKLRLDNWGKDARVIILSNLSNPDKERQAEKMGACDYIIKADYHIEDVIKRITKTLNKKGNCHLGTE